MAWPVAEAESSGREAGSVVQERLIGLVLEAGQRRAWRVGKVASGRLGLPDRTQKIGQTPPGDAAFVGPRCQGVVRAPMRKGASRGDA